MKVIGKPKDFGDIRDAWKMLVEKIGPVGNDFVIFSIKQRKPIKYFHARVAGNYIVVDRAKEHVETAIDFNQFRCVAQVYNKYIQGTEGPMRRDQCGQNKSYIISLIHHLL